jgi:hypothetical protein
MNNHPAINGNIQITDAGDRIVIAGDPEGLLSMANLLTWLSRYNQETDKNQKLGDRTHIHLSPGAHISCDSHESEICRLDAKGTKRFPAGFKPT